MRRPASAMLLIAACIAPVQAQDRFAGPFGGYGGNQFVMRCPAAARLTGVLALTGAYINGIAAMCDGRQRGGAGGGGDRRNADCPAGSVVGSMSIVLLRSDNHLVKDLELHCVDPNSRASTGRIALHTPGRRTEPFTNRFLGNTLYPTTTLTCGRRTAVGLHGRSGASIDAIGLICA